MKIRVGIAAALVAAIGAIALVAVTANSGGKAPAAAAQAGYTSRAWQHASLFSKLSTAMNDWNRSRRTSYAALTGMTQNAFNQTTQHGTTFAEQRGVVVLATSKFVILQSANGSLHLWLLSGQTMFQNVSSSTTGTAAMTASTGATQQAMGMGNMIPMTNVMAGGTQMVAQMLTPAATPQTITVNVAGTDLVVTVTITRSTAAVSQTATMPQNALPTPNMAQWRQNAWTTTGRTMLARGDLALLVGFRSHGLLHARLVLFTPMNTGMIGAGTGTGTGGTPTPTPTPSATATGGMVPSPAASSTVGVTGQHF